MSGDDVYGDDMEDVSDFEHPVLRDLRGDVRVAYGVDAPRVTPALAEFFGPDTQQSRSAPMRRVLAKLALATTGLVAATGGLAVAGALPAPVQNAASSAADSVGVDLPRHGDAGRDARPVVLADESTTTTSVAPTDEATTTTSLALDEPDDDATHPDNHGAEVSEVAHDRSVHGCEHGRAVSRVASGRDNERPCPHTETTSTTTSVTTTTVQEVDASRVSDDSVGHGGHGERGHGRGNDD